ncbi:beta-propeller fold lactonase family protein [Shewanella psychropiezotolerans]|uniref:Beta-propeller fold lactonase family protein n=1 Tax=Shewanella psychropiezotolerans TaxID=2593655 RepID=A0ABX5X512_9GAMM|nr:MULTISPECIES: beta-propeller fold lactonase family protein [Shewanella]MPY25534.1 beta-propeller fold lactonase family protein [Shewanella sp. YLB-07]QDO86028.1 beta-propeller fold lactonase family protein [Shewanella psychropiezotolerans]
MFNQKLILAVLCLLLLACSSVTRDAYYKDLSLFDIRLDPVHVLRQGEAGVEGLDNARAAVITPDKTQLLIVSADDDSVTIFDLDKLLKPTLRQVIRSGDLSLAHLNSEMDVLAGASNLVLSGDGQYAYIVSFYGSSLLVLKRGQDNTWSFHQLLSDGLRPERIFKDERSIGELDTLGLLGAWDVAITSDPRQVFVTSYKSSSLSVFDLTDDGKAKLRQVFSSHNKSLDGDEYGLSGAVGVTVSPDGSQVFTSAFEDNSISIFTRDSSGNLVWLQTINQGEHGLDALVNPQSLLVSKDNNWLYVACSGTGSLMVFKREDSGQYLHMQTLTDTDDSSSELGSGLALVGAGSLALTSDGHHLFVTAEADGALNYFSREPNGHLVFKHSLQAGDSSEGQDKYSELTGASSVMLTPNDDFVILTSGEGNALIIYRMVKVAILEER